MNTIYSPCFPKASNHPKFDEHRIDIAGSGLQSIPEVVLQTMDNVEELLAGQNQLKELGIRTIAELSKLRVLRLPRNGFTDFPVALLGMTDLKVLDLSGNDIRSVPVDISKLKR